MQASVVILYNNNTYICVLVLDIKCYTSSTTTSSTVVYYVGPIVPGGVILPKLSVEVPMAIELCKLCTVSNSITFLFWIVVDYIILSP